MESKEIFRNLGFSEYETKVLVYLSSVSKAADAKQISSEANVPLTKLYSILLGLERRNLIAKLPGVVNLYKPLVAEQMIKNIGDQKKQELEQKEKQIEERLEFLKSRLKGATIKGEVSVRHFVSDSEYWKVYNEEVNKLRKGDVYRIINSMRLCTSFIPEELKDRPGIKSMILNDLKKQRDGVVIHHMINVEALLEQIKNDLKAEWKIKQSIVQVLHLDRVQKKHHYITLAPELKNLLIVILKDSTFLEFYGEDHTKILTAIQIVSRDIAKDFAKWFDSVSPGKHDGDADYEKFKSEVIRVAREKLGIRITDKDIAEFRI